MNKVISTKYNECYYEEILKNGLKVVIWHKPNYEKSFALMSTPLGGFDVHQIDSKGNIYTYHPGVAHFLEHKMFEKENRDVMEDFSKMGANVNAATTYDSTSYYFQTSGDLEEPLNLLLDFTQSIDINEKSVEKEKGIIVQELNMYQQMSDFRLVRETFNSLYENHPLKYDVGGTADSVNETTLEELKQCFSYNYHPSSMICIVVTGKDPNGVMEIIRNNQKSKKFPSINSIQRKHFKESNSVVNKSNVFEMDVNQPKINIAFKLHGIRKVKDRMKVEVGLRFLLDGVFTPNNPNYQKWLDEGIINDFFGYDYDFGDDYGYLMIYSETSKKEEFIQLVYEQLNSIKDKFIDEDVFNQLKRRYYGENIRELNDFESIAFSFARFYFNGIHYFDMYDLVESIQISDLQMCIEQLDLENVSIVECIPFND